MPNYTPNQSYSYTSGNGKSKISLDISGSSFSACYDDGKETHNFTHKQIKDNISDAITGEISSKIGDFKSDSNSPSKTIGDMLKKYKIYGVTTKPTDNSKINIFYDAMGI